MRLYTLPCRLVRPSVRNISELRVVFTLLPLPNVRDSGAVYPAMFIRLPSLSKHLLCWGDLVWFPSWKIAPCTIILPQNVSSSNLQRFWFESHLFCLVTPYISQHCTCTRVCKILHSHFEDCIGACLFWDLHFERGSDRFLHDFHRFLFHVAVQLLID